MSRFLRLALFCWFCFDKREKGVFSWKKSMSVILRSFSGPSQLTWTCRSQKEHKMGETVHTPMVILKTQSFWTQKFFKIVTILSQSFNNIQKLQISIFLITFVFWNETHKSSKYVRNCQFLWIMKKRDLECPLLMGVLQDNLSDFLWRKRIIWTRKLYRWFWKG